MDRYGITLRRVVLTSHVSRHQHHGQPTRISNLSLVLYKIVLAVCH